MRASLFVLLTAGTAATTKPAVRRAVRYRGGETAQKKTLDDFLRHLGDGELEAVWEKAPKPQPPGAGDIQAGLSKAKELSAQNRNVLRVSDAEYRRITARGMATLREKPSHGKAKPG